MVDRVRVLAELDELVFETVRGRLGDFDAFKGEVLAFLKR